MRTSAHPCTMHKLCHCTYLHSSTSCMNHASAVLCSYVNLCKVRAIAQKRACLHSIAHNFMALCLHNNFCQYQNCTKYFFCTYFSNFSRKFCTKMCNFDITRTNCHLWQKVPCHCAKPCNSVQNFLCQSVQQYESLCRKSGIGYALEYGMARTVRRANSKGGEQYKIVRI